MLEEENILIGFAQVGIAMVGFTSLIAAVRRRDESWSALDRLRIGSLLSTSISIVVLCPLPLLLWSFHVDENILWRVSNFALAFGFIANGTYFGAKAAQMRRVSSERPRKLSLATIWASNVAVFFLLIFSALGVVFPGSAAPFLSGIVLLMAMSCYFFLLLLRFD